MMYSNQSFRIFILSIAAFIWAPSVVAQQSLLEEIVVTAQKREQNPQDVGISIAAFTGEQLESLGAQTGADITQVMPNMDIERSYGAKGFNTQITLRGVGQPDFQDVTEPTVNVYVDEFYLVSSGTQDFLMHDLQRVEVARGPQGTVFGRNSTAGTINFVSNLPSDELSVEGQASVGEHDTIRFSGHANIPVSDQLKVRVSGSMDQNDGYVKNIHPDRIFDKQGESDFQAVRGQALFTPNDDFDFLFKIDYGKAGPSAAQNEQSHQVAFSVDGTETIKVPTDAFGNNEQNTGAGSKDVINSDGPNGIGSELLHFYGRANWRATEDLDFVLMGGYMDTEKFSFEDCDDGPLPICLFSNDAKQDHWLVEVRGNLTKDRWRFTGGFNYMEQEADTTAVTPLFFDSTISAFGPGGAQAALWFNDRQDLKSWAIFGQFEFDLTEQLTIIGGIRYTEDEKEFNTIGFDFTPLPSTVPQPRNLADMLAIRDLVLGANPTLVRFNKALNGDLAVIDEGMVNVNASVNWRVNDDVLMYASYRRGVKVGGFIAGNAQAVPANLRKYDNEVNNAYEIGAKSTLLDGRARLNAAVFYYDYNDLQNNSFVNITNIITNNDTEVYGGEVELTISPIDGLDILLAGGYVDSDVNNLLKNNPVTGVPFVLQDAKLPLAPEWTGNASVRYEWPQWGGNLWVQSSIRAQTERFRDSLNDPSVELPGFKKVDAQIGYRSGDDKWSIYLWVNNLFDSRHPIVDVDLNGLGNTGEIGFHAPRWIGGTFQYKFF